MADHTPTPWAYQERSDVYTHIIRSGDRFIVQLAQDSKGRAEADARLIVKAVNSHDAMLEALRNVQKIIAEGAMTGFNYKDGDWAERLFESQQVTSAAIKEAV